MKDSDTSREKRVKNKQCVHDKKIVVQLSKYISLM